jgi:hypothetical protein
MVPGAGSGVDLGTVRSLSFIVAQCLAGRRTGHIGQEVAAA